MKEETQAATRAAHADQQPQGYSHAWRALRHRNFRLLITGQSISQIGTWMTRVATAWLVYRLTKSPWMLGAIGFANQIPMFLLAPVAGVVVDRMDRRTLLTWTQVALMVHSLLLAFLTLSHNITIHWLFVLSIAQGLVNTLDMPARQSITMRLVGSNRDDLSNAIAINSSIMNAARLIGPSLAGLLIAATSEGYCYLVDGISYVAVVSSLLMMRMSPQEAMPVKAGVVTEIREGWTYVCGSLPLRHILTLFVAICIMGWPFPVLMPIFAAQVLHGGPHTLGFLMGALGLGALISALSLAMRRSVRGLASQLPWVAISFGASLICFGLSHWLWLSLLLLLIAGFSLLRGNNVTNTVMQTIVDDKMRGRVMSYYSMSLEGLTPWGSLMAGGIAHALGAPRTVMISGAACILAGIWFRTRLGVIRKEMRPIYEKLGIRPRSEVAVADLQAVDEPSI